MPYYLAQNTLSSEVWATLATNPQSRTEATRAMIERLGGKLHGLFYSLGEYDMMVLVELPDNATAEVMAVVGMAAGSTKTFKITPLFTQEEALEFLKKAGEAGYRPPSS